MDISRLTLGRCDKVVKIIYRKTDFSSPSSERIYNK